MYARDNAIFQMMKYITHLLMILKERQKYIHSIVLLNLDVGVIVLFNIVSFVVLVMMHMVHMAHMEYLSLVRLVCGVHGHLFCIKICA